MAGERLGECGGVGDDLLGVGLERRVEHLTEGDGLGGDGVLERAALQAREHGLVDGGGVLGTAQNATTAGPGVLCVVKVMTSTYGIGLGCTPPAIKPAIWAASNMSSAPTSSAISRNGAGSMIAGRRSAGDDQFGLVLVRLGPHLVHVDALVAGGHPVADEVVLQPGEVDRRTVGEVAAVVEAETENRVARLEERLVDAHVRNGAGVRLHVRVVGTEDLTDAVSGEVFELVDDHVAAVVPLAGVTLEYLLVSTEPVAAIVAGEAKFSLAINWMVEF